MCKAVWSRGPPVAERIPSPCIVRAGGAHLQQFVSAGGPERMYAACVQAWVFDEIATTSAPPRCCAARAAYPTNPRNTPGGAAGIPTRARGRPGPAYRGTLRSRATAWLRERCCGCSAGNGESVRPPYTARRAGHHPSARSRDGGNDSGSAEQSGSNGHPQHPPGAAGSVDDPTVLMAGCGGERPAK